MIAKTSLIQNTEMGDVDMEVCMCVNLIKKDSFKVYFSY